MAPTSISTGSIHPLSPVIRCRNRSELALNEPVTGSDDLKEFSAAVACDPHVTSRTCVAAFVSAFRGKPPSMAFFVAPDCW
jgi:hypothetical protein